ncbi:LysR family transcriptional regulator [Pseudomonas sp. B2M1-30]|uniref:LysR family transcriptional regulator n=1 Tax=Pseudomonas koreensis TaxID=198620 RepID=A0A9X2XF41_9PSED|nr:MULTISPECIES: LysR family transcriptional regulator [Pseudomonas]MBV4476882.1 LysR family transcriptional regulator [Pseudomonas botevensis]MCU0121744.1 LysR family transcriptional regulator [Pseudomonas sp. B2M1-30]MCU7248019.1 LysR family transcriptional regulator [Pseudomonas koreensis]MCU7263868.1 LysR family transcriptional regulator [Pseudomonas koreensis]
MDVFQSMRFFSAVAQTGSFTAAAELLDTTTTNVSKTVSSLEARLHTRLINRTTRRLALTEAGVRYLQRCEKILDDVREADEEAGAAQTLPVGRLKIHTMSAIGNHYVIDAIARYREIHPTVMFDLTLTNRVPDLLEEGYDMSIVLARDLPDSGFVAQRLGITYSILCAAPAYLEKHGTPDSPAALCEHECLRIVNTVMPVENWTFEGPDGMETITIPVSPLHINTADGMSIAIRKGIGIGIQPIASAVEGLRAGTLVRILPEYRLEELNLFAIYPSRRFVDAKIKTWVEFLKQSIPQMLAANQAIVSAKN